MKRFEQSSHLRTSKYGKVFWAGRGDKGGHPRLEYSKGKGGDIEFSRRSYTPEYPGSSKHRWSERVDKFEKLAAKKAQQEMSGPGSPRFMRGKAAMRKVQSPLPKIKMVAGKFLVQDSNKKISAGVAQKLKLDMLKAASLRAARRQVVEGQPGSVPHWFGAAKITGKNEVTMGLDRGSRDEDHIAAALHRTLGKAVKSVDFTWPDDKGRYDGFQPNPISMTVKGNMGAIKKAYLETKLAYGIKRSRE